LQAVLIEVDGAEVFAIAAVLPLELDRSVGLPFEVDLAQQMAAILTLDRALARSEKSSLVFRAKYSHFRSSLQRRITVQVVLGAKHVICVGGLRLKMKIIGERFARVRIDYGYPVKFAILKDLRALYDKLSRFWTSGNTGGRRL
jgi:hypothetical protein